MSFDLPPFVLWRILALDIGGLILGSLLLLALHRRQPAFWVERLLWLTFAMATLVVAMLLGGGSGFLILRLWAHALFCVLAPLCMAAGLLWIRRRPVIGGSAILLGASMLAVYLWARHVEPFRLEVTEHRFEHAKRNGKPELRIVLLADLQTDSIGEYERGVFAAIDANKPDLLLCAGDYLQCGMDRFKEQQALLVQLFGSLRHKPRYGIYAVEGDADIRPRRSILPVLANTGAVFLRDRVVSLPDDTGLQIAGLALASSREPMPKWLDDAMRGFDGFTLVLGHAPDFAEGLVHFQNPEHDYLYLSGHCHGGQIQIPGIGPLLTLSSMPRRYTHGMHRFGRAGLMVSRGIGMERGVAPRVRLFCRPELVVITLGGVQ